MVGDNEVYRVVVTLVRSACVCDWVLRGDRYVKRSIEGTI